MKAKVVLLARVRTEDGKYPFLPVEINRGRPVTVENTMGYYLRYSQNGKRVVQPVGANIDRAFVDYQNKEMAFARSRNGLPPIATPEPAQGGVLIADAVTKYIADLEVSVKIGEKSKSRLVGYRKAIEDFRDHCGVEYINEITDRVLKSHKTWLFENLKKRTRGKQSNTVATRFRFLSVFFVKNGIRMGKSKNPSPDDKGLMDWSDIPRETKKEHINKYSEDEVNALLSAADIDDADLIQTFLRTGCRDGEIVYLHWSDVDFKRQQIKISDKPKYGWRPKDRESRTIPVEDGILLKRLAARKERQTLGCDLVFPNTKGEPDQHLIRRLHKVAEKAMAAGFEFEGDITLHRFRRTYASMMISHCDLQTVSLLLGHSDIQTTARYLAPDQTKARVGTRTAFKGIGD
jgi:integrase